MKIGTLSGKRDSNSRPRPWQGRALPTELFPHYLLERRKVSFFVPEAGIEPARPKWAQDFKSGASTYSATQALILSLQKVPTCIGI